MEAARILTLENPKARVESLAILPRKVVPSNAPIKSELVLDAKEEYQNLLYVGSSDGTIEKWAVNVTSADGLHQISAVQAQKRKFEDCDGPCSHLQVDPDQKDPRLLVLIGSRMMLLHYQSMDPMMTFSQMRALECGVTVCCLATGQEIPRVAAVVKKNVVCVDITDNSVTIYGTTSTVDSGMLGGILGAVGVGSAIPGGGPTSQIVAPDNVLQIAWHHFSLILGTKRDYTVYDVRTGQLTDQVVCDKMTVGPLLRPLDHLGGVITIRQGNTNLAFYGGKGRSVLDTATVCPSYSEEISDVTCVYPFLIGCTPAGKILIRSLIDDQEIPSPTPQSLPMMPRHLVASPLVAYAAVGREVVGMATLPLEGVIARYVRLGLYKRAIHHLESCFVGPEDKFQAALIKTHTMCGVHLFNLKQYPLAFFHFEQADFPPTSIVEAIGELKRPVLSGRQRASSMAAGSSSFGSGGGVGISNLAPTSLEGNPQAYELLYEFLNARRGMMDGPELATVDFALLMMVVKDKLRPGNQGEDLVSHIFVPQCFLDVDETLQIIRSMPGLADDARAKYSCLLMSVSGQHREALETCQKLNLVAEAIVPLQLTGELALFCEHLPWMMQINPSVALRAVCTPQRNPPPSEAILPILAPFGSQALVEYLGFLIFDGQARDPHVHTTYALQLIEMICTLIPFSGPEDHTLRLPPGSEYGPLGELRSALLTFLRTSPAYESDVVLASLVKSGYLVQEQAVVYARDHNHESALMVMVYELNDLKGAEQYCIDQYDLNVVQSATANNVASLPLGPEFSGRPRSLSQHSSESSNIASDRHSNVRQPQGKGDRRIRGLFGAPRSGAGALPAAVDFNLSLTAGRSLSGTEDDQLLSTSFGGGGGSFAVSASGLTQGAFQPTTNTMVANGGTFLSTSIAGVVASTQPKYNEFFNILLQVLVIPPPSRESKLPEALDLLERQSRVIDPLAVFEILPSSVKVTDITNYLIQVFQLQAHVSTASAVMAGCAKSASNSATITRSLLQQRFVFVDDDRVCVVCKKKIGDAVFGVFPNLKIAHFRCFKDKELDPIRGVPFRADL